jgi:hypothetical protein
MEFAIDGKVTFISQAYTLLLAESRECALNALRFSFSTTKANGNPSRASYFADRVRRKSFAHVVNSDEKNCPHNRSDNSGEKWNDGNRLPTRPV